MSNPPTEKDKANAHKDGGKQGHDLDNLASMGGIKFFSLCLKNTHPDCMDIALEAMNIIPDGVEPFGGARELGKFILTADAKKVAFRVNVPLELHSQLTPKEWAEEVVKRTGKPVVVTEINETTYGGELIADPDKDLYAEKIRDELAAQSFPFLRSKELLPEVDEDDDFICDPEAAGIGSW